MLDPASSHLVALFRILATVTIHRVFQSLYIGHINNQRRWHCIQSRHTIVTSLFGLLYLRIGNHLFDEYHAKP